jgi:hypothetical protein
MGWTCSWNRERRNAYLISAGKHQASYETDKDRFILWIFNDIVPSTEVVSIASNKM